MPREEDIQVIELTRSKVIDKISLQKLEEGFFYLFWNTILLGAEVGFQKYFIQNMVELNLMILVLPGAMELTTIKFFIPLTQR